MKLHIEHQTRFTFNKSIAYSIQQLRLTPQDGFGQRVNNWQINVSGNTTPSMDTFGNTMHTVVTDALHQEVTITAVGEVETDLDLPAAADKLGLPVYLRSTELTEPNAAIVQFSQSFLPAGKYVDKSVLNGLMDGIYQHIQFDSHADGAQQSAINVFTAGKGLTQGIAHTFISCCRVLKIPARIVHGYCFNLASNQLEDHSWADAWLSDSGWHSFDVANNSSANGVHIRLATGLDYRSACPVSSSMYGSGKEQLSVSLKVHAMSQMQQ